MFKRINKQNGSGIDNQNWHGKEHKVLSWVNLEQVTRWLDELYLKDPKEWLLVTDMELFWYFSNWDECATWNCCQPNLMRSYGAVAIISASLFLFIFYIMFMMVGTTYMQWLWRPEDWIRSLMLELQIVINYYVGAGIIPGSSRRAASDLNYFAISPAVPPCVRVIVTTCTMCGTSICKCLQRRFTSQTESLINFITTFSLPKMVLCSLLTCIIQ